MALEAVSANLDLQTVNIFSPKKEQTIRIFLKVPFLVLILFVVWMLKEAVNSGKVQANDDAEYIADIETKIDAATTPAACASIALEVINDNILYLPPFEFDDSSILSNIRNPKYKRPNIELTELPPETLHVLEVGLRGAITYQVCLGRLWKKGLISDQELKEQQISILGGNH